MNSAAELSACVVIPLSVELKNFELTCSEEQVILDWSTNSEINNDFFQIEKANSNGDFQEIMRVTGNGNNQTETHYQWIDKTQNEGQTYYKLSQIDLDGTKTLLKTLSINFKTMTFKSTLTHSMIASLLNLEIYF